MIYRKWTEIPIHLASKTEWKKRGYKVPKGTPIEAHLGSWNGMYYQNVALYHKDKVIEIRGGKAQKRRNK